MDDDKCFQDIQAECAGCSNRQPGRHNTRLCGGGGGVNFSATESDIITLQAPIPHHIHIQIKEVFRLLLWFKKSAVQCTLHTAGVSFDRRKQHISR